MLQRLINKIFSNPSIFIIIRRILENNFKGEKNVIKKELNLDGETLDVGCGTGEFCTLFRKEKYLGIDLSEKYIEYARKKYGYNFKVIDAAKMGIEEKFENILVCGIFHHLDDASVAKVLESAKKMLKDEGILLVIEDTPTRAKWNLIGKIVQHFDVGKFIRKHEVYGELYKKEFKISKLYTMMSGVNDYSVYVLQK